MIIRCCACGAVPCGRWKQPPAIIFHDRYREGAIARDAARAILLEPSPWAIDERELIDRDPRKIPVEEFTQARLEGNPLLKVIRAKCLDCCVQQEPEVRKCVAVICPNWPYRMGAHPFHKRELTEEQRERLAGNETEFARSPRRLAFWTDAGAAVAGTWLRGR
jgi:hypothetical protein